MKTILAGIASLLLIVLFVAARPVQSPNVPTWEYRVEWDLTNAEEFNALGAEGWELVAVSPAIMGGYTGKSTGAVIFKRPTR